MWRPLEVFLYDWWPIRREAKNFDRLAAMLVRISYTNAAAPEAWRGDWPAVSSKGDHPKQSNTNATRMNDGDAIKESPA